MKLKKLLIAVSLAAVAALSVTLLFDVNTTEPSAEKRGNGGPSLPPVSPSYK